MIESYVNPRGITCYAGVEPDTLLSELQFHKVQYGTEDNQQWALHTNLGSLTVLDRMTGFGWRDVESGYRDKDGKFWLASGNFDVRNVRLYPDLNVTVQEAIDCVKQNANNCKGE